jgi:hypothetical protein
MTPDQEQQGAEQDFRAAWRRSVDKNIRRTDRKTIAYAMAVAIAVAVPFFVGPSAGAATMYQYQSQVQQRNNMMEMMSNVMRTLNEWSISAMRSLR